MISPPYPSDPTTRYVATVFHTLRGRPRSNPSSANIAGHGSNGPSITSPMINELIRSLRNILPPFESSFVFLDSQEPHYIAEIAINFTTPISQSALKDTVTTKAISGLEVKNSVEIVLQPNTVYRRHKRLAVFDMDSTLIQQEVIDEMARKLGVEDAVSAITARAMNGELDFTASLRERCALLKGVPSTVFEELKDVITLTPGAGDLVRVLKRLGYKTAVLSGGFTPLTSWQAERLGLDYAFANHLVVSADGATLTGEVTGEIVNAEMKRQHLLSIAKKEGILPDQVLAVGDGANDLLMLGVAGLGVAFNAKTRVQIEAPARLNSGTLLDVLYLLGFHDWEQEALLAA